MHYDGLNDRYNEGVYSPKLIYTAAVRSSTLQQLQHQQQQQQHHSHRGLRTHSPRASDGWPTGRRLRRGNGGSDL